MKQVVQSFKTGELAVQEVPSPSLRARGILVRTAASLVSAGTERMVVDFAEKNLVQKARARPDLVKQVVDKAQREGVLPTIEAVRNRLDQPMALGYSSAGVVVEVGSDGGPFRVGDRVACAGGGFASHAELVYVPRTLAVPLPEALSFEQGAFGTLGAIALQGIRQAEVVLGCQVAVIGLGLLGQLTVMMLKAAGCRVVGIDLNPARVALAQSLGADVAVTNESALEAALGLTGGRGVDAVLITADTKSSDPVVLAGDLARDRGVVVAVGAVGLEIPRKVYYEKELDFRLSRSYGPGRYDPEYEEKGNDYPYGYVRWTEGRNIEAFLGLVSSGSVKTEPLTTHRFPIDQAERAYDVIMGKTGEPFIGVLLTYDIERPLPEKVQLPAPSETRPVAPEGVRLGLLGAGGFVNATLLPALKDVPDLELVGIVSGSGMSARSSGERFGFAYAAANEALLFQDDRINWVAIATRHDLHAQQAVAVLDAGKHAFVEKPLSLNEDGLRSVVRAAERNDRQVIVGFNRRFAPMVQELKRFFLSRQRPIIVNYRVNAGAIPASHWTQDPAVGGGRIIGEGCHFIDLIGYLTGATPVHVSAVAIETSTGPVEDEVVIMLTFDDGSVGTVTYAAGGDKSFSKERIEIIGDGRVGVLDDYRSLELIRGGKRSGRTERLRPDKGHRGEWVAIAEASKRGAAAPIPLRDLVATHLATYAAVESLRARLPIRVDVEGFWSSVATEGEPAGV